MTNDRAAQYAVVLTVLMVAFFGKFCTSLFQGMFAGFFGCSFPSRMLRTGLFPGGCLLEAKEVP